IDPPYNTGNDFVYKDNFAEGTSAYWEHTGVTQDGVKMSTNTRADGRFHSNWLNMIYPRLLVARQLLREDGVIFVSIDDNEVTHLRKVMDEVFGEECFLGQVIWHNSSRNDDRIAVEHEYILVYGKNIDANGDVWTQEREEAFRLHALVQKCRMKNETIAEAERLLNIEIDILLYEDAQRGLKKNAWLSNYRNIDIGWNIYYPVDLSGEGAGPPRVFDGKEIPAPPGRHWMSQEYIDELQSEMRIVWRGDRAYRKLYIEESKECLKSVIRIPTRNGSEQLKQLIGKDVFDKPKPTKVIGELIRFSTKPNDLILDFFAGSGSTAHAIFDIQTLGLGSRRFIGIQIPEETDKESRAYQAGFKAISEITVERIKRSIKVAGLSDVGFKVFTLEKSAFPRADFAPDPDASAEQNLKALKAFIAQKETNLFSQPDAPAVRDEVLLKCGFQLDVQLTPVTEVTANQLYRATDQQTPPRQAIVCFDTSLDTTTLEWLRQQKGQRVILLEAALDTTAKWNLRHALGDELTVF
ncbi:MAG: site-specific DNA-methyltransferase, partial [Betaproteobacteria bacterium]